MPGSKPTHDRHQDATIAAALARTVVSQIGGHIALDFCNTAGEHLAARPEEELLEWESFIRWAVQTGLIEPRTYPALLRHPSPIEKIVQLREAVYRVGLAIARGQRAPQRDLDAIRQHANASKPPIVNGRNGLCWQPDPPRASAQLRAILASEALSMFCSSRSSRIGVCEGGMCGWLFLDESRGKRRRWCDMNDCGSRAKARRYYERQKGS